MKKLIFLCIAFIAVPVFADFQAHPVTFGNQKYKTKAISVVDRKNTSSLAGGIFHGIGRIMTIDDMSGKSDLVYPVTGLFLASLTLDIIGVCNQTSKYDKASGTLMKIQNALIYGYAIYSFTDPGHNTRIGIPFVLSTVCYRF